MLWSIIRRKWYELIYIVLKDHCLLCENGLERSMDTRKEWGKFHRCPGEGWWRFGHKLNKDSRARRWADLYIIWRLNWLDKGIEVEIVHVWYPSICLRWPKWWNNGLTKKQTGYNTYKGEGNIFSFAQIFSICAYSVVQ